MILDNNLLLDSQSAITASASSQASANVIDLFAAQGRDLGSADGAGLTPKLMVMITTAFASTNSATLNVQIQGAPDNGSGSPGSYTTMAESGVLTNSNLVAGARILELDLPRPQAGQARPRFLRLNYVVGTGVYSTGAVTSALVLTRDDIPQGAAGYNGGYAPGITVAN
ncbi:Bbp16 family capsid cement protein [Paraburkholderia kururiensis]|uniref:Bbp16 family capsid cement protein n=1 Tax=Paraburkholderia kururiensis TaxID=984307 RepID=UPI00034B9494|nr:hypothetical protein [Paraburkholderia kururiensis]